MHEFDPPWHSNPHPVHRGGPDLVRRRIAAAQAPAVRQDSSGSRHLDTVRVTSHHDNAVGTSDAASAGHINPQLIADRPMLRPAEVMQYIPGMIITQHSGGGKANRYFLRAFNLDHGADLETTLGGRSGQRAVARPRPGVYGPQLHVYRSSWAALTTTTGPTPSNGTCATAVPTRTWSPVNRYSVVISSRQTPRGARPSSIGSARANTTTTASISREAVTTR